MITLEQGINVARRIEDVLKEVNCHCALGGSVLHKGSSNKDLDIFIYHRNVNNTVPDATEVEIITALEKLLPYKPIKIDNRYFNKIVYKGYYNSNFGTFRIDFFLL